MVTRYLWSAIQRIVWPVKHTSRDGRWEVATLIRDLFATYDRQYAIVGALMRLSAEKRGKTTNDEWRRKSR